MSISVVEVQNYEIVEVVDERVSVVEIAPTITAVLEVVAAGPQGPPGDVTRAFYLHTQNTPSKIWTVVHNFNAYPGGISVKDMDDVDIDPTIVHSETNLNALMLMFEVPTSGYAYIS